MRASGGVEYCITVGVGEVPTSLRVRGLEKSPQHHLNLLTSHSKVYTFVRVTWRRRRTALPRSIPVVL